MELQKSNEELLSQVNSLKVQFSEMESTVEDHDRAHKTKALQYQSDISRLKANNNQIVSSKLALETELEHANDTVNTLRTQLEKLQKSSDEMKEKLQDYKALEIRAKLAEHPGDRLMKLDMQSDANWYESESTACFILSHFLWIDGFVFVVIYCRQFVGRCRNIFINTNKLTPKLIMQLIESTSRCISVFHQSKSRFAHCIHQNEMLSEKFSNLQDNILERYNQYPPRMAATPSLTNSHSKMTRQKSRKRALTNEKSNKRRVKIAGNGHHCVEVPHIRKPTIITKQQPHHHGAYEELYVIAKRVVTDAQHDMRDIADAYQQPFDYSMYNVSDSNTSDDDRVLDGEVPVLDWDQLAVDPSMHRYEAEESIRDQERFVSAYNKFRASVCDCEYSPLSWEDVI